MNIIEAIFLGILQGLSEFLPISSTGHLTVAGKLLGLIPADQTKEWTAFIAVIQLGTLAAVLIYFFKDIIAIIKDFFSSGFTFPISQQPLNARLGWMIIIGTIPVVVIGLFFKHDIEGWLTKNLYVIAISLIVLALFLALAEKTAKHQREMKDLSIWDAFIVGIAQSLALIPGSSRSGTTITGGLFTGMTRETAARFSFLLSIPAVFASGMLELKESLPNMNHHTMIATSIATLASAISGYLAIDFLIKYLRKNSTYIFIVYRIILGAIILALLFTHIITP
jgi:undecaprenyl-diphosphatase